MTRTTCKRCSGALLSIERIADELEKLRRDAERSVAQMEATDDPFLRAQAEADYIDAGHEQLAAELRGVCTVCTLGELGATLDDPAPRRWIN